MSLLPAATVRSIEEVHGSVPMVSPSFWIASLPTIELRLEGGDEVNETTVAPTVLYRVSISDGPGEEGPEECLECGIILEGTVLERLNCVRRPPPLSAGDPIGEDMAMRSVSKEHL